jgi:Family of unknown function (DUF5670)
MGMRKEGTPMLWIIVAVLVILWLLGFIIFHVTGWLIHLLLVVALIVIVINLLRGRRS